MVNDQQRGDIIVIYSYSAVKNPLTNVGDTGSITGSRSSGEGSGSPLQYSCLGKSHEQRRLAGYNSWGHKRGGHGLATKQQQQQHSY